MAKNHSGPIHIQMANQKITSDRKQAHDLQSVLNCETPMYIYIVTKLLYKYVISLWRQMDSRSRVVTTIVTAPDDPTELRAVTEME